MVGRIYKAEVKKMIEMMDLLMLGISEREEERAVNLFNNEKLREGLLKDLKNENFFIL